MKKRYIALMITATVIGAILLSVFVMEKMAAAERENHSYVGPEFILNESFSYQQSDGDYKFTFTVTNKGLVGGDTTVFTTLIYNNGDKVIKATYMFISAGESQTRTVYMTPDPQDIDRYVILTEVDLE